MISQLSKLLPNFRMTDLIDIALVSILIYVLLLALKRTRTTFLVVGFLCLAMVYLLAISLELQLTRYLFQLVFAVSLIGVIVMFHEELRLAAERFLSWRVEWRRRPGQEDPLTAEVIDTLIGTVTDLAAARVGALIVIAGRINTSRFVRGGWPLDGIATKSLFESIFDPHSLGHDGAVLLSENRVERFACHLPLSTDSAKIGTRGTRHAAALGLSERTDSLCLVVSEERGTISIARHGQLEVIDDLARLSQELGDFYREISPTPPRRRWYDALRRHPGLKAAAALLACLLWFLIVHESSTEYHQFVVEPRAVALRVGLTATIEPKRLRVVVSGPRRTFYFRRADEFRIDVKLFDRGPGIHEIFLTATDVDLPEGLTFVNIAPTRNVRVTIDG